MKDSFILFTAYKDTVDCMTDVQAGLLFKMILNYESGNEPLSELPSGSDTDTAYIAFTFIKRQLDSMNEKYEKSVEKQREAGKKGAEKRWGSHSEAIGSDSTPIGSDSNPIAEDGNPINSDSTPIGSDSTLIGSDGLYEYEYDYVKEKPSKEGKKKSYSDDPVLDEAMKSYADHRKKIKAPLTDRAVTLALNKLEDLAPGDTPTKVEIINQSIMNGWKGLFALHGNSRSPNDSHGIARDTDLDDTLALQAARLHAGNWG